MTTALIFATLSLLANLFYVGIFIMLNFSATEYSTVYNAVSDYAVGKHSSIFRIGLWSSSVGVLALAIGLSLGVKLPSLDSRGLIYLLLVVIFRIAMSLFPTDIEGHRLTRTGQLHYLFAILTFTFTYMAISNITPLIITDHPWSTIHGLLNVLATLAEITIFLVVVMLLPKLRSIFGLFERLFLVTSNTWIILIALFLIIKTA